MQAVAPDNVCNIIILLTVCQFHSLYFHIFLTAFSLYIPTNFMSVFYEVYIQVENILYYV